MSCFFIVSIHQARPTSVTTGSDTDSFMVLTRSSGSLVKRDSAARAWSGLALTSIAASAIAALNCSTVFGFASAQVRVAA